MYLHTSVPRQIPQIGITIPPKVTTTPIRDQGGLEQEITHWKPKAMAMEERFTQDQGEGSTTTTIVEERFMFPSNNLIICLLALIAIFPGQAISQKAVGDINAMTGFLKGLQQGMAQRDAQEAANQQFLANCRSEMHPKLLSLTSDCVSLETENLIFSTLNTALEMDSGSSSRNWSNRNTGSFGTISVHKENISAYGNVCREFNISFSFDGKTQNTSGTACRVSSGNWRIL
jgi:surface antigen